MSFTSEIAAAREAIEYEMGRKVRASAVQVLRRVIKRTPRDTGMLKGNWQVSVNTPASGTTEELRGENITIAAGTREISKAKAGDDIYIVNNLPYAQAIEGGHSDQAPQGMVAVTVAEWKRIVGAA